MALLYEEHKLQLHSFNYWYLWNSFLSLHCFLLSAKYMWKKKWIKKKSSIRHLEEELTCVCISEWMCVGIFNCCWFDEIKNKNQTKNKKGRYREQQQQWRSSYTKGGCLQSKQRCVYVRACVSEKESEGLPRSPFVIVAFLLLPTVLPTCSSHYIYLFLKIYILYILLNMSSSPNKQMTKICINLIL